MTKNGKNLQPLEVIGIIVGALAGIFAIIAFFTDLLPCKPFAVCTPQITFTYEGSMSEGEPVYEVAEGLYYQGDLGSVEIVVNAEYDGKEYGKPVVVKLVNSNGDRETVARWENFQTDHKKSLTVEITPDRLFQLAGLPAALDSYTWQTGSDQVTTGQFQILVETLDGKYKFDEDTVTVLHTPWYHLTQLSSSVIHLGEDVQVSIQVNNLGAASNFAVEAYLYDATEISPDSLTNEPDGWWASKSWPAVNFSHVELKELARQGKGEMSFTIPDTVFQKQHVYVLSTVVYKEIPYLELPDDSWEKSDHKWRYRDHLRFDTIVVLQ